MRSMDSYPKAAMERAMKVQDVMLQAMAKKITWGQVAEILGISDRHMRRWRERYVEEGYNGLFDRRRVSRRDGGCRWRRGGRGWGCTGRILIWSAALLRAGAGRGP